MSTLRSSFATTIRRRPRGQQSLSNRCLLFSSRNFNQSNKRSGSTRANKARFPTTNRIGNQHDRRNPLRRRNGLLGRTQQQQQQHCSPAAAASSSLVPDSQNNPWRTTPKEETNNNNNTRKRTSLVLSSPTNRTAARGAGNFCAPSYDSFVLPPESLLGHKSRQRFGTLWQNSGPPSPSLLLQQLLPPRGNRFPVATNAASRLYSSSTRVSMNRFRIISPQMIGYRAGPTARSNQWLRIATTKSTTRSRSSSSSSSGKGTKNEKDNFLAESTKSKDSSPVDKTFQEFMDSTVSTVRTNVGSAEATVKRAVEELSSGDLLSVYGIVLFIAVIAFGPSMIRRMQSSDGDGSHYNVIDPEDPVMDLARMIRNEYLESIKRNLGTEDTEVGDEEETEENKENKVRGRNTLGLDRIVADLLKSPQIQEAATNLVTRIIQSSQFKNACQLLLKELLKDLLDDPETLKQVIHLLQNAIVDEKIKEAAVQLATDIFGDDRVLDELVVLVQRLGMEQQVKHATQALLVESAHNALNDPEILDHSMEFATDVVGDDVVQQTAGEALYNTMSYAFRPTLSVLLTLLGFGLIGISIAAFRNLNETPSDAADRAFFNAVEKTAAQLMKIILLPVDILIACKDALVSLVLFPFRFISSSVAKAGKLGQTLLGAAKEWILWVLCLPAHWLSSFLSRSEGVLRKTYENVTNRFVQLWGVLDASIIGIAFHRSHRLVSGLLHRLQIKWMVFNHQISDKILLVETFGTRMVQDLFDTRERIMELVNVGSERISGFVASGPLREAKFRWMILNRQIIDRVLPVQHFGERIIQDLRSTCNKVVDRVTIEQGRVARLSISLKKKGKIYSVILSREYHILNRQLAGYAIRFEDWIRNKYGFELGSK